MLMILVLVLVCSWERIFRLRTFPFWDGYCNYLSRRDVYQNKILFLLSVWYSQSSSMFNVFDDGIGEEGGLGTLQVLRKVTAINGKHADYANEIQVSHKLGYPSEGSTTFVFTYENKVFRLGQHLDELTSISVTKTHYLAYWKEDSGSGGSSGATSIKGDRGVQGKRGATGGARPIGPHGPKGVRGDVGLSGGAGVKGGRWC